MTNQEIINVLKSVVRKINRDGLEKVMVGQRDTLYPEKIQLIEIIEALEERN